MKTSFCYKWLWVLTKQLLEENIILRILNQCEELILTIKLKELYWILRIWTWTDLWIIEHFGCWFRIDIGNNTSFPVFLCLFGWYHQVLQNFISKWIALECEDMHLTQDVLVLIIVGVKVKTWKTFILVLASTVIKIAFLIARRRTF